MPDRIYPETRPLWFLREQFANNVVVKKPAVALESHQLSCEMTGGLPCAHSMTFTVFVLILASFFFVHCWDRFAALRSSFCRCIMYLLIIGMVVCMWLSRLYLATEFLHQCILGSYLGIRSLCTFEGNVKYLFSRPRRYAVSAVFFLGGLALSVYYVKLELNIDPHWSVREVRLYMLFRTLLNIPLFRHLNGVQNPHICVMKLVQSLHLSEIWEI